MAEPRIEIAAGHDNINQRIEGIVDTMPAEAETAAQPDPEPEQPCTPGELGANDEMHLDDNRNQAPLRPKDRADSEMAGSDEPPYPPEDARAEEPIRTPRIDELFAHFAEIQRKSLEHGNITWISYSKAMVGFTKTRV